MFVPTQMQTDDSVKDSQLLFETPSNTPTMRAGDSAPAAAGQSASAVASKSVSHSTRKKVLGALFYGRVTVLLISSPQPGLTKYRALLCSLSLNSCLQRADHDRQQGGADDIQARAEGAGGCIGTFSSSTFVSTWVSDSPRRLHSACARWC